MSTSRQFLGSLKSKLSLSFGLILPIAHLDKWDFKLCLSMDEFSACVSNFSTQMAELGFNIQNSILSSLRLKILSALPSDKILSSFVLTALSANALTATNPSAMSFAVSLTIPPLKLTYLNGLTSILLMTPNVIIALCFPFA